jgi:hypothetical protein
MSTYKKTIHFEYEPGDVVFQRTAIEKCPGQVTSYSWAGGLSPIVYCVSWGDGREGSYFSYELVDEFVPDYGKEA